VIVTIGWTERNSTSGIEIACHLSYFYATGDGMKPRAQATEIEKAARLLGGVEALRKKPSSQLEVHDLLQEGLPPASVKILVDGVVALSRKSLFKGFGITERTFQRHLSRRSSRKFAAGMPRLTGQRLNPEQSGRIWKFASILAKATEVLGSREAAERWLEQPAIGLGRKRPIDLLSTTAGAEMVGKFLGRLEYGVYS
jgi:putative toxin-antitoxin system antitoxin component (TIGR02293 family)